MSLFRYQIDQLCSQNMENFKLPRTDVSTPDNIDYVVAEFFIGVDKV